MPIELVNRKENVYFAIGLTFSILIYLALIVSLVGLFYIPAGIAGILLAQGLMLGRIRGNAVRVSPRQFPDLYATAAGLAQRMGLAETPAIYVLQEGGFLNAFATRFIGRNFMIVYSDLYALAKREGAAEVEFVVAHEMAHLVRRHTLRKALIWPADILPFFGAAYSRACEYTADAFGAYAAPRGAASGMLLLASGKHLYRDVDGNEFLQQAYDDRDFFVWFAEKLATHPTLPNRLVAIARVLNGEIAIASAPSGSGLAVVETSGSNG